ncbi:MAG: hypothetical protein JXA21_20580 [Anaerolineae bacterium]|nr:hypothetical protein [Anaerolineae bacterium]
MSKIIERIELEAGISDLVSILSEKLSPTDLQSLLLEVYRIRSSRLQPAAVLSDYESNRFVRPAVASPLSLLRWEQIAFSHLPPEFLPIELSPVCPLGTNSVVAQVDQNWAVSTARNTEVVSDSTNVLALECALRRREILRVDPKSSATIHLAASHRLLRAQRFEGPLSFAHFSLFGLCSAGRDQGSLRFELAALQMHVRFYLTALRAFLGSRVPLHFSVTNLGPDVRVKLIEDQLLSVIQSEFAQVDCAWDEARTSGRGYYRDLCFHIHATDTSGQLLQLADGGSVDWTQKYLSNAKERLVTSGIGSERLCAEFGEGESANSELTTSE